MCLSAHPKIFIFDFDGTMTTQDTIATVAKIGISAGGQDLNAVWDSIVTKYTQDYSKHVKDYDHSKGQRQTLEEEIMFCRSLQNIEQRSFTRVSQSGLFKGISETTWDKSAQEAVKNGNVVIRNGFVELVERIHTDGGVWSIVSVNFSVRFIRGILSSVGKDLRPVCNAILANQPSEQGELQGLRVDGKGAYHPKRLITTSNDKLAAMKETMRPYKDTAWGVVYIGDSGTDIECLMDEGVIGIVMSDNGQSRLIRTLRRLKVGVVHIADFEVNKRAIYWARDFTDVMQSSLFR